MKIHKTLLAALTILFAPEIQVSGADVLKLPFGKEAPVLDGRFDDACWKKLKWNSGFRSLQTLEKADPDTRFKMFHDGKKLFIAIEALEPEIGKVRKEPVIFDSATVWMNDSIEFFLCTDSRKQSFYQLTADAAGQHFDARYEDNNAGGYKSDAVWDSGVEIKTSAGSDCWRLELALPLGMLEFQSGEWSFNLVRNRSLSSRRQLSSFAPNPGTGHARPEIFLPLRPEQFPADAYGFRIDRMMTEFRRTGADKYAAGIRLHISSRAKMMRILRVRVRLLFPDGKIAAENV